MLKKLLKKHKKINEQTKLIAGILVLGLILRLNGGVKSLLFTYDQARDAVYSMGITAGHIKIVGPPSDIPGLFHGPLFYYLIAPAYFLAGGYPNFVFIELVIINLLAALPLFVLVKKLFNSSTSAIISVLLYAVSFEVVSYARWISNPSLAIPAFATLYLGLWMVINKEMFGWLLLAIGCGVAIQSEIFLIYLIPIIALCLFVYKVKLKPLKLALLSSFIFSLFLLSFALAELKFHFQGANGLRSFLLTSLSGNSFKFGNLVNYYTRLSSLFASNLIYGSKIVSSFISLAVFAFATISILHNKHRKSLLFVLFIFFSSLVVFVIATFNAHFVTVGATVPFLILVSYALWQVTLKSKVLGYLLICLLLFANVMTILKYNKLGNVLFQIQDGMIFGDEINLVQKTYQISNGGKFSINAVTNPLFNPTTWAYLYQIYAKYNHLDKPFFHGDSDPMSAGYNILERSGEITSTEFSIVEPNLPKFWVGKTLKFDEARKPATETTNVGLFQLVVRKN